MKLKAKESGVIVHVADEKADRLVAGGQFVPLDFVDAEFDPARHTAREVVSYLANADEGERQRVLDAEAAGKARDTVLRLND